MLVNHLAKRHPDIKPDSVPELNLPILRTQRDYFCQYCEKVYKSSSKRKLHILKYHPGADLPVSVRKASSTTTVAGESVDQTFSMYSGSLTTLPNACEFCHKQYASRAKLLQHQRKIHPSHVQVVAEQSKKAGIAGEDRDGKQQPRVLTVIQNRVDPVSGAEIITLTPSAMQQLEQVHVSHTTAKSLFIITHIHMWAFYSTTLYFKTTVIIRPLDLD